MMRMVVGLVVCSALLTGTTVTVATPAVAEREQRACGGAIDCHLGTPVVSGGPLRAVFVMPKESIQRLNLRSARIVLARVDTDRPMGLLGDYINVVTGWLDRSTSETVLARMNPSKRGNANGDLIIATKWTPSRGRLDPSWTYAATLVSNIPGRGETVLGSISVDPGEVLDPVCAIALGTLLTARDTAIGVLDTFALTNSVLSVATGDLPGPLRKHAAALGIAGDASLLIKAVSASYDEDDARQLVIDVAMSKVTEPVGESLPGRVVLAGTEADALAAFLLEQGETNGQTVIDTCYL